jgi:hypothetical protein
MTDPERSHESPPDDAASALAPPSGLPSPVAPPTPADRDADRAVGLPPPTGRPAQPGGEPLDEGSQPDRRHARPVLGSFKPPAPRADALDVNDALGDRPRLTWDPVSDGGGAPTTPPRDDEGFSFNLGQALARLGVDGPGAPTPRDPLAALTAKLDRPSSGPSDPAARPPASWESIAPDEGRSAPGSSPGTAGSADIELGPLPVRTPSTSPPPADRVVADPLPVRSPSTEREPSVPAGEPAAIDPVPVEQLPVRTPSASEAAPSIAAPSIAAPSIADLALPTRGAGRQASASDAAASAEHDDPTPAHAERHEAAPTPIETRRGAHQPDDDAGTAPRPYVSPRRSVFDDVVSPNPALPPTVVAEPNRSATTARLPGAATSPPAATAPVPAGPSAGQVPAAATAPIVPASTTSTPIGGVAAPGGPVLPSLPVAPVAAPVVAAVPDLSPLNEAADLRALRSAQLRATRHKRTGRVIGRALLVLLVLGGLVAAGLAFGRSYLFPVEWDPALTQTVDIVQRERGADFQHTVGLVLQTDEQFDQTAARLTVGDAWVSRVPEWRALGLVAGAPTLAGIAPDVAAGRTAVYDPSVDRIYLRQSADAAMAAPDLRLALEQAYDAQLGTVTAVQPPSSSLAGVSAPEVIARRAVESFIAARESAAARPAATRGAGLPLPLEYELVAVDTFGETVLEAAGVDPTTATFQSDVSGVLGTVLADAAAIADPAPIQVGERALAEPVALGTDDWSLAWGVRLSPDVVDQLVPLVVADSYQPIDRGGVTCVSGVFQVGDAGQAAVLVEALNAWVAASPAGGAATVMSLTDTRVQLLACDPGPDAAVATVSPSVTALVNRQLSRLAG